jgi:CRP/FNR family transcriptional regulator
MDILKSLPHIFIFDSLTPKQLELFASFVTSKHLAKGEQLFNDGEKAFTFYGILAGKLKIYKISPDGQEHTLEIHSTGDLVAEAAIFDRETYPAHCSAMEDSLLLRIPKDEFIDLIIHQPDIGIKIMHSYSKRLRKLVNMLEDLTIYDVRSRLVKFLLKNCVFENGKTICRLNISKKELSALINTIPETLSRTIKRLKTERLLVEEDSAFILLNLPRLRSLI